MTARPWIMRMRWRDLLFAHWTADAATLRDLLPRGLELELFGGQAYVGVIPFRMENVTSRFVPAVPGLDAFPEMNLRTYVTAQGQPGVWFFSLDAGQKLAVRAARRFFHLPYFDACFAIAAAGDWVDYAATRTHRGAPRAEFHARYRPTGDVFRSTPGSLEHWLTERYCLYSVDRAGNLYRGDIQHGPWPLEPAEARIETNTLADWLGIRLEGPPLTLHFARELNVHAWMIERI